VVIGVVGVDSGVGGDIFEIAGLSVAGAVTTVDILEEEGVLGFGSVLTMVVLVVPVKVVVEADGDGKTVRTEFLRALARALFANSSSKFIVRNPLQLSNLILL
jgi:hypothetical protein